MSTCTLLLKISNTDGKLGVSSDFASDADRELVGSWPGRGVTEIAFMTLVEAIRREVYCQALATLSAGRNLNEYELREKTIEMLTRQVLNLTENRVKEVLMIFPGGLGGSRDPSLR